LLQVRNNLIDVFQMSCLPVIGCLLIRCSFEW
jgi:hypothetical protein